MTQKNLQEACNAFITHLQDTGVAANSIASYSWNLRLLVSHFGPDKQLDKLLPPHVAGFFRSEAVTTKVTTAGEKMPRTPGSIAQIKRVTRWALCWFNEQGWISTIPLPADEKKLLKPKTEEGESEDKPIRRNRKAKGDTGTEKEAGQRMNAAEPDSCISAVTEPDDYIAPQAITEPEESIGQGSGSNDARTENAGAGWLIL